METQPYTDDTVLLWGEYKFMRVSRIPPHYLLSLSKGNTHDKLLLAYVENNRTTLEAIARGETPAPKVSLPCKKRLFVSQKEAKDDLKRIRKLPHNKHKKPKREYECTRCGGWHHTSLSLEEWQRKARSFT